MTATCPSLTLKVETLVREQIRALTKPGVMDKRDILEYHLRHYQIMQLYREIDEAKRWFDAPVARALRKP
jgi:hypothetical protein